MAITAAATAAATAAVLRRLVRRGPAYGYVAPVYPYAYPAPGFGVATRNFSFWLGQ